VSHVGRRMLIVLLRSEIVRLDERILGELGFGSSSIFEELFEVSISSRMRPLMGQE
jgi:hypothetical protein